MTRIDMSISDQDLVQGWLTDIEEYQRYFKDDDIARLLRPLLHILKSHETRVAQLYRTLDDVPTKQGAAEIAKKVMNAVVEAKLDGITSQGVTKEVVKEIVAEAILVYDQQAAGEG